MESGAHSEGLCWISETNGQAQFNCGGLYVHKCTYMFDCFIFAFYPEMYINSSEINKAIWYLNKDDSLCLVAGGEDVNFFSQDNRLHELTLKWICTKNQTPE